MKIKKMNNNKISIKDIRVMVSIIKTTTQIILSVVLINLTIIINLIK
jgi:hypothetical protein